MRLITELRRNIEIATCVAPAGTVADTASGADVEDVTRSDPAASGAGATSGAVACPSGVRRAAGAAVAARAGGAVHVWPAGGGTRAVAGDAIPVSTFPRPSVIVATTRKLRHRFGLFTSGNSGIWNVVWFPVPGMAVNVVPFAAVCCHCQATDTMLFTSASVLRFAVSVVPSVIVFGSGVSVIDGTPVGAVCGGAAVAVPVSVSDCVLFGMLPELFVATSVADLGPAVPVGRNVTCTVQLAPGFRVVVHVVVPSANCVGSVPPSVNRVAAVNDSGLSPLLVSVNERAGVLTVPTCWLPNAVPLTAVSVASGAIDTS